jgi:DNA-binding MarR family transcriptional regulator
MGEEALRSAEQLERSRLESHDLSWLLRLNNRAAEDLDRALGARMGLRPLEYDAMGAIMDSESDPVGPVELAHRLGISAGSATELVDRLERAGHVARERSTRDRRRVLVVPRDQAVGRLVGELTPLVASLDEFAEEFTPDEQRAIGRFLQGATERMSAHAARLAGSPGEGDRHGDDDRDDESPESSDNALS